MPLLELPSPPTQDHLHRRAPIDVAAGDRLLRLPPERFPQPAAFDYQLDALQGEVVWTQGGDGVRSLRLADGLEVEPGHQPVGWDLQCRVRGFAVEIRLVRHIRRNLKNPALLRLAARGGRAWRRLRRLRARREGRSRRPIPRR